MGQEANVERTITSIVVRQLNGGWAIAMEGPTDSHRIKWSIQEMLNAGWEHGVQFCLVRVKA